MSPFRWMLIAVYFAAAGEASDPIILSEWGSDELCQVERRAALRRYAREAGMNVLATCQPIVGK